MNLPDFNLPALMGIATSFLGVGAEMGRLGDYPFYMHHNDYKQLAFNGTSDFSTYKPIKGLALTGDSGGTQGTLSLNGVLVAEPIHALSSIKDMWLMREPIRLTTLTLDTWVVITNYNEVQSNFYIDGTARVSRYSLTLKEVYGELV
jgi:phage protein U